MKISETGIALIKKYEGYHLTAYRCPAGIWTIGYGHTKNVTPAETITPAKADEFLREDLEKHERNVSKYESIYHWNQNEFDALVSFSFNLGSIDKLTADGTRDRFVIADKMLLYNKANGRVLNGLTRRRKEERDLFLKDIDNCEIRKPLLKIGCRGTHVTYVQMFLHEKGMYHGAIDGIYGAKTKEAVRLLQESVDIKADGIVGDVTWQFIE